MEQAVILAFIVLTIIALTDPIKAQVIEPPPIPPSFEITNIGDSSFNVSWTPSSNGNPGSVFIVQYKVVGSDYWLTSNSENSVQKWKVISGLLTGTTYQVRMLVRDANNKNDRISSFETISTTGVAPIPPSFEIANIGDSSFNVSWTPSSNGNPGSVFLVQFRVVGTNEWKASQQENSVQRWKVISGLLTGTTYQVRMAVRDGNSKNERISAYETISTTGVVASITTASWFVGMMCVVALLVIILIIVCIVKRNRGGKYPVQEKEKLRQDTLDNGGFGDQPYPRSTLDRGGAFMAGPASGSIDSADKPLESESGDSLAEYAETDNCKFNEDGSFIGQYGGRKADATPDTTSPAALSTFV